MPQYMLSVHSVVGEVRDPMTAAQMQTMMQGVSALEEDMKQAGAWVFGGRLTEPDAATVVRVVRGEVMATDGPFVESKEHLGGFYLINADDLDGALSWASRTTAIIGAPIEVRALWDPRGA